MRIVIDTDNSTISVDGQPDQDLYSSYSFGHIANLWTNIGWVRKYSYAFSWMGRPIIQLPDDMVRTQEAIWEIKPDVIIETGVAHGGSLIYYASLMEAMGHGQVIGVDIEIRPQNRTAIEAHPMFSRITLVEGDSTDAEVVGEVAKMIEPHHKVMVILDSNHLKAHVAGELTAYADFVSRGSYLIVCDGIMQKVAGMPRTGSDWEWNNPISAIDDFLGSRSDFVEVVPSRPFDESLEVPDCSHHPRGWLKRR